MVDPHEPKVRRWSNIVVIIAAAWCIGSSMWGVPPEAMVAGERDVVASESWLVGAYVIAGALGLAAIFLALRAPAWAKGLTAAAGLLVLSGFLALDTLTPLAALSIGLTGVAFLAASPFMGPMPVPEEEGKPR